MSREWVYGVAKAKEHLIVVYKKGYKQDNIFLAKEVSTTREHMGQEIKGICEITFSPRGWLESGKLTEIVLKTGTFATFNYLAHSLNHHS